MTNDNKKPVFSGVKKTVSDIRKNCTTKYYVYLDVSNMSISGGPDEFFPEKNIYMILEGTVINGMPIMSDITRAAIEAVERIEATKAEIAYYEAKNSKQAEKIFMGKIEA
jgi:hypothetical protein